MTVTMQNESVLKEVLSAIDAATSHRGEISPSSVVSIIDNLAIDLGLAPHNLPTELQVLRAQAQARSRNSDVGYREDHFADTIVMCGLWAA